MWLCLGVFCQMDRGVYRILPIPHRAKHLLSARVQFVLALDAECVKTRPTARLGRCPAAFNRFLAREPGSYLGGVCTGAPGVMALNHLPTLRDGRDG